VCGRHFRKDFGGRRVQFSIGGQIAHRFRLFEQRHRRAAKPGRVTQTVKAARTQRLEPAISRATFEDSTDNVSYNFPRQRSIATGSNWTVNRLLESLNQTELLHPRSRLLSRAITTAQSIQESVRTAFVADPNRPTSNVDADADTDTDTPPTPPTNIYQVHPRPPHRPRTPSLAQSLNVTLTLTGSASGSTLSRRRAGTSRFSSSALWRELWRDADQGRSNTRLRQHQHRGCDRHPTVFPQSRTPLTGCRLTAADANGDTSVVIQLTSLPFRDSSRTIHRIANTGKYPVHPANRFPYGALLQTRAMNTTHWFGDTASYFVELVDGT